MFDADSYLEAMEPPTLKVGGQTYTGRHLSLNRTVEFRKRLVDTPMDEIGAYVRDFCEATALPVDALMQLPPGAVLAALDDFFGSLYHAGARTTPAGSTAAATPT